ncbi:MAG: hypothetical protein H6Q90_1227 [Deltaproteobacteria bacterium]|nr:hypothetical protein [Deltaproteobacteria bacterium]
MVHEGQMSLPREQGERDLAREPVTCLTDGRPIPDAMIIVTDRRIVLMIPRKIDLRVTWTRPLLRAIAEQAKVLEPTAEIRREDFAAFEIRTNGELGFRGRHASFTVVSPTPGAAWQGLLDRWLAGTLEPAPLPTARVVKR